MAKEPVMSDHYAQRPLEDLGEYYCRHVQAMTRESLHSKSDIAAELAWRDRELDQLRDAYKRLHSQVGGYLSGAAWDHWQTYNEPCFAPEAVSGVERHQLAIAAANAANVLGVEKEYAEACARFDKARAALAASRPPCDHKRGFYQFEGDTFCRNCHINEDLLPNKGDQP